MTYRVHKVRGVLPVIAMIALYFALALALAQERGPTARLASNHSTASMSGGPR